MCIEKEKDLYGKIVYFEYNGMTEQGWIKDVVDDEIVTVCSYIHQGNKDKDLYTEIPIYFNKLQFNPIDSKLSEKYEELKDAYDALHMTYLSQVSLYKSLYEEEKKKNNIGDGGIITLDSSLFPHVKWEDEPIEVTLTEVCDVRCEQCKRGVKYDPNDVKDDETYGEWGADIIICPYCGNKICINEW